MSNEIKADTAPEPRPKFVANSVLVFFSWFVPLAVAFIATPILIGRLGNEVFGIFSMAVSFLSYAFVTGMGRIVSKYIPEFNAAGDRSKLSQSVTATFIVTTLVAAGQAILIILISPYLVGSVLNIDPNLQPATLTAFYYAAISGFVMMVGQLFFYSLQGVDRFDIFSGLTIVNGLMLSIGNIVLVLSGNGLTSLMLWNLVTVSLTAAAAYIYSHRIEKIFRFTTAISSDIFKSVTRYAGSVFVYQTLGCTLILFERIWIVRKYGADELPHYVVPMMLTIYMHGMLATLLSVFFPYINKLLNDKERLVEVYTNATTLVCIVVALCVTGFIAAGRYFLTLWIGEEFAAASAAIFTIHAVTFGLSAIALVVWQFNEAFHAAPLNAATTIVWVAISAPLMVVAAEMYGLEKIAEARLVGMVVTFMVIPYFERRFMNGIKWAMWASITAKLAAASVLMYVAVTLVLSNVSFGWPAFILAASIGSLVYFAVLAAMPAERKLVLGYASGVLKR